MKEKKLRRIAEYIVEMVKQDNQKSEPPKPKRYFPSKETSQIEYCEIDENNSKKFVKFINNLVKQKINLKIDINENYIIVNCENPSKSNGARAASYNNTIFEIRIDELGFRFCRESGSFYNFSDKTMLEKLRNILTKKNQELSNQYLEESIDELTVKLNLSRENNLDEILS